VCFAVKSARILAVFLECLGSQGAQPEAYVDPILCCGFAVYDGSLVLIIGSGAGGGTLGNELAQKGIRTLILEAGPRIEREQHIDDERQSLPN
jgi:hypothetical protein